MSVVCVCVGGGGAATPILPCSRLVRQPPPPLTRRAHPPQVTRDAAGAVTALRGELHLAGDFKKTEKKLTWLCANADAPAAAEPTPLILRDFDYLITVPKLEEGDDFEAAVNPRTVVEAAAVGEAALRGVGAGAIVQLERKGFYRVDVAWGGDARPAVLFAIPDGRPKTWGVNSPDDLKARQAREAAKRDAEAAAKAAAAAAAKAAKIAAKAVAPPAVPATA